MRVGEKKDSAHLFLRTKKVIASPRSFSSPTAQSESISVVLFYEFWFLAFNRSTVYLYKSMGERSNLGKRASLGWVDGVLLFSVGLAVRITMIHVLAVGAGVGEALEALGALEGLFAAVQPLVFSQMMLVLERSWTLHTFVGPLPWNNYHLSFTDLRFVRVRW